MAHQAIKLTVNGEDYVHTGESRLSALIRTLHTTADKVALVVNGRVIPFAEATEHHLAEGDRIDILTLAGGG